MAIWLTPWQDLNPTFAAPVLCALATLEHAGVQVVIPGNGGKRSDETQIALYAQGRTKPGNIVTNCDGVNTKSMHQRGLAVDVVPMGKHGEPTWPPTTDPIWKVIRDAFFEQGIESGMDWKEFPDYPHHQRKGV